MVQIEGGCFHPTNYLLTTHKDLWPFVVWCIDLLIKLHPVGPNGEQYVILAVHPFTKWVAAGILACKDALTVVHWFHINITCYFGVPLAVCTDRVVTSGGPLQPTSELWG